MLHTKISLQEWLLVSNAYTLYRTLGKSVLLPAHCRSLSRKHRAGKPHRSCVLAQADKPLISASGPPAHSLYSPQRTAKNEHLTFTSCQPTQQPIMCARHGSDSHGPALHHAVISHDFFRFSHNLMSKVLLPGSVDHWWCRSSLSLSGQRQTQYRCTCNIQQL